VDSGKQPDGVVLLSGGLDSATTLAIAREEGFAIHALSFDYNQRHRFELASAAKLAHLLGAVDHRVMKLDLSAAGGVGHSALTDDIAVPRSALRQASLDPELLGTEGLGRTTGRFRDPTIARRGEAERHVLHPHVEVMGKGSTFLCCEEPLA